MAKDNQRRKDDYDGSDWLICSYIAWFIASLFD